MEIDPESLPSVLNRLKRANGQLNGVIRMIEEGRECDDVVMQLAAVSKAVERAGFAIIAATLRQCVAQGGEDVEIDTQKLEKLFLSLG